MVDIDLDKGVATFRIRGWHKLWALKSRIVVAAQDIVAVEGPEAVSRWAGWRIAGTWMPGVLTAGTFRRDGGWIFWDVADTQAALVLTLRGHWYSRLVIEVARPDESRRLLTHAMRDNHASPSGPVPSPWNRSRRAATHPS